MWTALALAIVAAVGAALYGLGRSWLAGFRQGGYDEAKAEEERRDLEDARKQKAENDDALQVREAMRRATIGDPGSVMSDDEFKRPE